MLCIRKNSSAFEEGLSYRLYALSNFAFRKDFRKMSKRYDFTSKFLFNWDVFNKNAKYGRRELLKRLFFWLENFIWNYAGLLEIKSKFSIPGLTSSLCLISILNGNRDVPNAFKDNMFTFFLVWYCDLIKFRSFEFWFSIKF